MTSSSTKPTARGGVPSSRAIELYSPNYFAACTLGGIIGKLSFFFTCNLRNCILTEPPSPGEGAISLRPNPHGYHTS